MSIGTKSSFKVYNEFVQTGVTEVLMQAAVAMNSATNGAMRFTNVSRKGDYVYDSFYKSISGLVSRRIAEGTGSTSAVTDLPLEQAENVSVKLNRKIGPVANTLDSFKKIQQGPFDEDALNLVVGQQAGKAMQLDFLNTGLRSVTAALLNTAAVKYTVPSSGTLNTASLVSGLAKFGDAADDIVAWIMHSAVFFALVQNQITANIDGVSGAVVANGSPITLNRPVIVTDSSALFATSGSPLVTDYYTLGLTSGALTVEDSEETTIHTEMVTGLENLVVRMQGEFAFNVGVKGFAWDVTNGGKNPTNTAVATGTNWDKSVSDDKQVAGVVIQSR